MDRNRIVLLAALVAVAGIVAWAVIRVTGNRADAAKAAANAAALNAEAAQAEKEAQIRAEKAAERQAAANEAALKKAEEDRRAAEENRKAKEAESRIAADEAAKAEADRDARKAAAAKEASAAEAEQAKASAARAEAEKAKADARAKEKEADAKLEIARLEAEQTKAAADRAVAEAAALQLRSANLDELARQLMEFKQDLDERELALRPEKTILDLETTHANEETNSTDETQGPVLRENDRTIPRESRALARANRLETEMRDELTASARSNAVSRLESLYIQALRDDRVADANFYRSELQLMYPGWKYVPGTNGFEKVKKEEVKK